MTIDVSDLDLDDELAALAAELHEQLAARGEALVVHRPPAPSTTATVRPRRMRRYGAVAAAAAAVAIIIGGIAVVGRSTPAPSSVAAEGTATTATPAGPWRVSLDPASGYVLAIADRLMPPPSDPASQPETVDNRPITSRTSAWVPADGAVQAPMLAVMVTERPDMALGDPYVGPGETAITVDGRPGKHSVVDGGLERIAYSTDDHLIAATAWGIDLDGLLAAMTGAQVRPDGQIELANPPTGLVRRDVDSTGFYAGDDRYDSVYVPQGGTQADGEVSVTVAREGEPGEWFLESVARAVSSTGMGSSQLPGATASLEAITVHGQPAVLTSTVIPGSSETYSIMWHDPTTAATIAINTYELDRAGALALVDHLVPTDDATWNQLSGRCANPMVTVAVPAC